MPSNTTQIQVPDRLENDPPATPEQLQFIRQLVTGMSLHGFRFDYRRLGKHQAQVVTDQLLKMKDTQDNATPAKKKGPSCMIVLVRRMTMLIVWGTILAVVAAGGYAIYWRVSQTPSSTADNQTTEATDDAPSEEDLVDSKLFPGLKVQRDPNSATDTTKAPDTTTTPAPVPSTPPVAEPEPIADKLKERATRLQLDELDRLLVKLSQFTRNDYPQAIRIQSATGMTKAFSDMPQAMSAIQQLDATLPQRIRDVINRYSKAEIDAQAMRTELTAIRDAIKAMRTTP